MFANRLRRRYRCLRKWARRLNYGALRLYDRDIPEIPLVVDTYGSGQGIDAATLALYRRPYEKDQDEEDAWLSLMKTAAAEALGVDEKRFFLRERRPQRNGFQYSPPVKAGEELIVPEGDLRFIVKLDKYLDTGLFSDRRKLRALIRSQAEKKRCLNLFCYTGSFSIAAAAGGALSVDSVDLSAVYLDWAARNAALNGVESVVTCIRADARRFLEERSQLWDMIILDPPAFSNSKKMNGDFDLKRDHARLVNQCLKHLAKKGVLYLNAAVKGFSLDRDALTRKNMEMDITEQLRDRDFERRIPACFAFSIP
jgi:23S rRNA G2069 N7-methylase RlmK/C1962 C5-methylase RlmI